MKITYKKAQKGMKFCLTLFGAEKEYVRSHFECGFKNKSMYERKVPVTWVEKGYVMEVANDY